MVDEVDRRRLEVVTAETVSVASPLWKPNDAPPEGSPLWVRSSHQAVVPYVRDFLTAPHPYRSGTMCPYIPAALRSGSIHFAAGETDASTRRLLATTQALIEKFSVERTPGVPSALIILFPADHPLRNLLHIHRQVKVWCVRRRLMVGVLSPVSDAWSIHSRDFFPLRTPVPTLVVRDMALFDTDFLVDGPYSLPDRVAFLQTYLHRFNGERHAARPEVRRARELYQRYVHAQQIRRAVGAASLIVLVALGVYIANRRSS